MSMGMNQYPHSLKEATNTINTYNNTTRGQQKTKMMQKATDGNIEMFFAQSSKNDKTDQDLSHIACVHCQTKGHYAKKIQQKNSAPICESQYLTNISKVQMKVYCNEGSQTTN